MDHLNDGYVTEVPYSVNHFPEMAPAHLNLALLQAGLVAPSLDVSFTYLELGFGQGLGLDMLAAIHPQARFFGNDFMPEHVQAAQALADAAGLDNLQLFEDSFAQLLSRDLPPMDYIVMHGVYTWVSDQSREHIIALLQKLLKPGGVAYISYNCLPGWSLKAPMQRLMVEFARREGEGTAVQRFHAARDVLSALDNAAAGFFATNPPVRAMLREIESASDAYLLHEFAPQGWTPFYHTDVAQALAAIPLDYACSARLFANFPEWSLLPATRTLLQQTQDSGMRELLRDFASQTLLRRDVFVRGARRQAPEDIQAAWSSLAFALLRPPASVSRMARTPVGEMPLESHHEALLQSLAAGPLDIEALRQLPAMAGQGPDICADAMNMLACLGHVGAVPPLRRDVATTRRVQLLNKALLARLIAGERISGLVSPRLGSAIGISWYDLLFLAGQQAGHATPEALAIFAAGIAAPGEVADNAQGDFMRGADLFLRYGDGFYASLDLF